MTKKIVYALAWFYFASCLALQFVLVVIGAVHSWCN